MIDSSHHCDIDMLSYKRRLSLVLDKGLKPADHALCHIYITKFE